MESNAVAAAPVKRAKKTSKQTNKKKHHVVLKPGRTVATGKAKRKPSTKVTKQGKSAQKQRGQNNQTAVKAGRRNFVVSIAHNGKKDGNFVVVLTRVPALVLMGKARLRCIYGSVKVCGYEITDEACLSGAYHDVYSPASHGMLTVQLSKPSKTGNDQLRAELPKLLNRLGFSASLSGDARVFLNDERLKDRPMAVLVLERLNDPSSDLLDSFQKNASLYSCLNTLGFDLLPINEADDDGEDLDRTTVSNVETVETADGENKDGNGEANAAEVVGSEPEEAETAPASNSTPSKHPKTQRPTGVGVITIRFDDAPRHAAEQFVSFCDSLTDQGQNAQSKDFAGECEPSESIPLPLTSREASESRAVCNGASPQSRRLAVAMVFGPKDAGKSTFCRLLINRLLSAGFGRVAHVELDASQSEFAPAGCVSCHLVQRPLFGPSFTHLCDASGSQGHDVQHVASVLFGSLSPLANPDAYFDCVRTLFSSLHSDAFRRQLDTLASAGSQHDSVVPVVVNTCGWLSGLGASLHLQLASFIRPHHVIELDCTSSASAEEARAARSFYSKLNGTLRHRFGSQQPLHIERIAARAHTEDDCGKLRIDRTFTSADRRDLNLLAYFGQLFSNAKDKDAQVPFTDLDLTSLVPYRVGWSRVYVTCMPHGSTSGSVAERSCFFELLNASVVALCVANVPLPSESECAEPCWLPSAFTNCLQTVGFGIVRAIDPVARCFFVLSPLPVDSLKRCNVLAKIDLELPAYMFLRSNIMLKRSDAPYIHKLPKLPVCFTG